MNTKLKYGLIGGFIILFLSVIAYILTKLLKPSTEEIVPDEKSKNRLQVLNETLTYYVGEYWKSNLMAMALLVFIFIIILYFANSIDLTNCTEETVKKMKMFWIISLIIIILLIITISIVSYQLIKKYVDDNYGQLIIPDNVSQIIQIVLYAIVIILFIGLAFYVYKKLY
jgi:magnesium-transporting ATPase (P-type)